MRRGGARRHAVDDREARLAARPRHRGGAPRNRRPPSCRTAAGRGPRRRRAPARGRARRARSTSSVSATGVMRVAISRSISAIGISGPANAKQSSVSCAITRLRAGAAARPHASSRMSMIASVSSSETRGTRACGSVHVGGDRHHVRIVRVDQRLADARAIHLELGMRVALVALDDDEVDRGEPGEQLRQGELRRAAQLAHQGETVLRRHQHLGRSGHAVHVGILAGLVHVERVVRVLERRDREAARRDRRDELGDERGLAGAAPAGQSDDAHGRGYSALHPPLQGEGRSPQRSEERSGVGWRRLPAPHPARPRCAKTSDPPPAGEGKENAATPPASRRRRTAARRRGPWRPLPRPTGCGAASPS